MIVSHSTMQKAADTLNLNSSIIAATGAKLPIGCAWCTNCSGIVGD